MHTLVLSCGTSSTNPVDAASTGDTVEHFTLSAVPNSKDLGFLKPILTEALGVDSSPSLDEMSARDDVAYLGAPTAPLQKPDTSVRVILAGTDAALNAVATKLMRLDMLWVELGYVPEDSQSTVAKNWGLNTLTAQQIRAHAAHASSTPTALIRDDLGGVILGSADIIPGAGEKRLQAEVIVDSDVLYFLHPDAPGQRHSQSTHGVGVRLVATTNEPGLVGARLLAPTWGERIRHTLGGRGHGAESGHKYVVDTSDLLTGRATQAGGQDMNLVRDGLTHPRSIMRYTAYRHLRDLQAVRL